MKGKEARDVPRQATLGSRTTGDSGNGVTAAKTGHRTNTLGTEDIVISDYALAAIGSVQPDMLLLMNQ
jgi:hypothetical protein